MGHLPSLFAIFAGVLFLFSVTIGCGRCLVCAQDTDCTQLNWVTIARITALGFPSRLYALSMFILALTLGVQSELHGVLYGHTGCRRSVGWLTAFSLFFRVIFPEDVYNEASLPLLEEAQPEGDGGRALSVIALCMFILWAALNVMDTSRDQRINNRVPLLAKTGGLSLVLVTSLVTVCCRSGVLDWPKTGAVWEGMSHVFMIGQLIMSMWETHKMEFRQKVSPKKSRMVTLAFIVLCCILFLISAITGCQHCLQCYSHQESCRQLSWVSLARITAIGSAGRLLALSKMCFATAFMWQSFLLGLWCDLSLLTRLLSHLVSWTVLLSIVFPQHVYQQGAFAYQVQKATLPVAEPESTLGGISTTAAICALSIWQICFFVQRIVKTSLLVTVIRILGLGIALIMSIVYFAAFYENEELIFEWGTELYAMCLIWIFLILTFATTVYETYDMGVTMFITSPVSMKNASTIAPFGLSANERAAHGIDGDQRMLNITQDTIPQSRHQGYNSRQQRVPQPQPKEPPPAHWCPEVGECPLCTAHAQGHGAPSTAQPEKQSSGGGGSGSSGQFVVDPVEQPAVPMTVLQSKLDVDGVSNNSPNGVSNNSPVDNAPLEEQAISEPNPAQTIADDDGVATDDDDSDEVSDEAPKDVKQ